MQIRFQFLLSLVVLALPATSLAQAAGDHGKNSDKNLRKGIGKDNFQPIKAPFADAIAELSVQSAWEQNTRHEGPHPDKSARGVYPVGNGHVFTYMGLGERANTMMGLTGPTYAASAQRLPRGNFGELTMDLGTQALGIQRVRRVSGANFVVTEDRSESGIALRTLTFAAPAAKTITRVVVVTNGTQQPVQGLRIYARLSTDRATARGDHLTVAYRDEEHRAEAVFKMAGAKPEHNALAADIGELAAGQSFATVLTITTGTGAGTAPTEPALDTAATAAKATIAWWKNQLAGTPQLTTNHRRIMDLVTDWKVLMLTMRDARSGVVTPMVTRRGAFIRESSGPILTFLRFNMWAQARTLLDYFYHAICLTGEVREHYPLDLDFSPLRDREIDLAAIKVPSSDLASWVIVQHFWYFRATQDVELAKSRQPFLLQILRKQRRGKDSLMHFSGHENYMTTLHALDLDQLPRNPLFIAEAPAVGRRSYSLASSVLFLIAIQGYGEILDGIDRAAHPAKWNVDDTMTLDKPSQKWLARSFEVMQEIEKRFYVKDAKFAVRDDLDESLKFGDDWTGFFAPAISPVSGKPHKEPFANINLLPLWLGFTFPSGERSRHNLRNTLGRLWYKQIGSGEQRRRKNTLVGATATVGHFTGDVPGMLLTALIERDGKDRVQALQDILEISAPAGEWGQFYAPSGRPIAAPNHPQWPDRMSPNECGINLDAVIYALNGVRHVNVPYFDNKSIKVKLRLPPGATFLNMDNLKKDGRAFNVHVDEFYAPLSAAERQQNDAQQDKRYKRDPNIDHRRFRFRMRLLSDNPPLGHYQVDADVSGTMFVRYLYKGTVNGQSGEIDDREFWQQDQEPFFLDPGSKTVMPPSEPAAKTPGSDLIVLTNRPQCAAILGHDKVTYVDTGLPMRGQDLVRRLLHEGKATHKLLLLDVGYDASDRRTFKQTRFWQHPNWRKALADFEAGGGTIIRPAFVEKFQLENHGAWTDITAKQGRLELPGGAVAKVRFQLTTEAVHDEIVLRLGSGCGYTLRCNGTTIGEERDARIPIRDQDSLLVALREGANTIEISLATNGQQVLFVQVTNTLGLPLDNLLR